MLKADAAKQSKYTEIIVDLGSLDSTASGAVSINNLGLLADPRRHASQNNESKEPVLADCTYQQSQVSETSLVSLNAQNPGPTLLGGIRPYNQDAVEYAGVEFDGNTRPRNISFLWEPQGMEQKCPASPFVMKEKIFTPYPRDFLTSYYGISNAQIGGPAVDKLRTLPIEPSVKNVEFLSLFIERLSPFMSSIDGKDSPSHFNREWLPFMIQSPLVAYIGILTASYFDAAARGIEHEKSVDIISTKVKLISGINEYLKKQSKAISNDAISTVMSLAHNEWIYNEENVVIAHMKGLREMIRLRGGLANIHPVTLRMLLTRTDYQIACSLECDLFLDARDEDSCGVLLDTYPIIFDSPLLPSKNRLVDSYKDLKISLETAAILDDMRFLTISALSLVRGDTSAEQTAKFITTANWIHKRVSNAPPLDNYFYETCRSAAIVYSTSMLHRKLLSQVCTAELLGKFWMSMWRVSLSGWKKTPGIFLWLVLVMTPFAQGRSEGRFLKSMISASIMAIGLENWEVVMIQLRAFVALQKWLKDGVENKTEGGSAGQISAKSKSGNEKSMDGGELANRVL
ncbi:hypothetical protein B7463_g4264, partial [Scytalidium lignicola]